MTVRYFTGMSFHTKLYIVDNVALIGSANLTNAGLISNREASVVLKENRDECFADLPAIFDELWNSADVLTQEILSNYTNAYKSPKSPKTEPEFQEYIEELVPESSPKTIKVGSERVSRERAFLQRFRRKYDERLVPAHSEIMAVASENGFGRPEYDGHDPQIEMGRFLGWLRVGPGAGDGWIDAPVLADADRRAARISAVVAEWQSTDDTVQRDMYEAESEIVNIGNIREFLCDSQKVKSLSMDELFDYLSGCHAFRERLRFVSKEFEGETGLDRLRASFKASNDRGSVVNMIDYLLSGRGDPLERAYDCIYGKYKINGFGEACVMELLGWGERSRPPFNNRSIRGMRFLGFDVADLVAGE